MRLLVLIAIVGLSAAASPVASKALVGVYSSVRIHPETGDLIGDEIEFLSGPRLRAVVTICEGDCWGGKAWPVTVTGNRITIPVQMQGLVDQDGHPVKDEPRPLSGRLRGEDLRIDGETLKRLRRPRPHQTAILGCGKPSC